MSVESDYEKLVEYLSETFGGESSQMFGKKCIKVNGKAVVALFKEFVVFKLPESQRKKALSLDGAILWDPSSKGRPMKEWVQVPLQHKAKFKEFAAEAANYAD